MITRLVAPSGVGPACVGPAILEKVVHSRGALLASARQRGRGRVEALSPRGFEPKKKKAANRGRPRNAQRIPSNIESCRRRRSTWYGRSERSPRRFRRVRPARSKLSGSFVLLFPLGLFPSPPMGLLRLPASDGYVERLLLRRGWWRLRLLLL
jgi:hypothetical protein